MNPFGSRNRLRLSGSHIRLSAKWRSFVATGVTGVMIVGLGAGAYADSQTSSGASTSPKTSDPLQVTVGKTIAVTTDQKGNVTPFNVMLINGQVSGQGSGQVTIPTGPDSKKTFEVSSKAGQVDSFFSVAGGYKGQLPVTGSTLVKVNGKSVDPDQAYGLNGNVEVQYVFVNHTSKQQTISYVDIYGKTTSKTVDIPVPFANSYSVTFGKGWAITDSGGMSMSTTPLGTKLASTVVLFPVIEGVGGTTQTLTIKAKAQNASLPPTKSTIIPVPLGIYKSGLALGLGSAVEQKLLTPLSSTLDSVLTNVISAANLISGYTGGFESLAKNYIDPITAQVNTINLDPNKLDAGISRLSTGLSDLSGLMAANSAAQYRIANLFNALASGLGVNVTQLVKWLGSFVTQAGPASASTAEALTKLNKLLTPLNLESLGTNAGIVNTACAAVGPTSDFYGYQGSLVFSGGDGATALAAVIKANKKKSWATTLGTLQTQLDAQSAGTLIARSIWLKASLAPAKFKPLLQDPACQTVGDLTSKVLVPFITGPWSEISPKIPAIVAALDGLAEFADSPAAKGLYNGTLKGLDRLSKLLSNGTCTTGDLINPITSAIKRFGPAGIKAHIGAVLTQVFSKCGLAQVLEFLGDFDRLLGNVMGKFSTTVDGTRKDVPKIVNAVDKAKGLTNLGDTAFNAIPEIGQKVADAMSGGASKAGGLGETGIGKVSNFAAELQAKLVAMNARGEVGDGAPYGNATGPNAQMRTLAVYQVTVQEASPYNRNWTISIVLTIFFLLIALGLGTFLYRGRRTK